MALDATIGGANANSYQDRTEAGLYFADHLYAGDWSAASTTNQDKALIMAARRMEQEEYIGVKVTTTQALKFPRVNRVGTCSQYAFEDLNGNGYDSTSIPKPVKYAQCEVALALLQSDVFSAGELGNLKALDLGPIQMEFGSGSASGFSVPLQAWAYLGGLVITTAQVVRA